MIFRCRGCHASVWVQAGRRNAKSSSATCDQCGQTYTLMGRSGRGGYRNSIAVKARRVAAEHELDLPSAYTVALGIADVEELAQMGGAGSTACRTAPGGDAPVLRYDRAYEPAIRRGLLTPRQAAERGTRSAYAAILASRHRLSETLALAVADNRVSLLAAVRRTTGAAGPVEVHVRGRGFLMAGLTAASILVALTAWLAGSTREAREVVWPAGERTPGDSRVRTDSAGRVVEIRGPDPLSVLRTYCAARRGRGRFEPLGVVPSSRPGDSARLGLLRDPHRPADLLAIRISEDRVAGYWLARDEGRPLIPGAAPAGAEAAVRGRSGARPAG